jgi:hypothetical protein
MVELLRLGAAIGLYEFSDSGTWTNSDGQVVRWLFRLRTPEGRYVRMDIDPRQGAAGVRKLLPELAPLAAWETAIEAERIGLSDPVAVLVFDLRRLGHSDPRWSARWTLHSAWQQTADSQAMVDLLGVLGLPELEAVARHALASEDALPPGRTQQIGCPGPVAIVSPAEVAARERTQTEIKRWQAEAIRRAIPTLPDLEPVS